MPKRPRHPLNQSVLYHVQSRADLAKILGTNRKKLDALAASADQQYSEWNETTDNGKIRHIESPNDWLKPFQAKIAGYLRRIEPPDFLFCPVKGRSNIDNAMRHARGQEVRAIDIVEFYPSVPRRRVYWFFHKIMRCSTDVAATLANILTRNGRLPTGSPSSDIIAFYAYYDLWRDICKIVEADGKKLSLYVDDLIISGNRVPDRLIWEVKKKIHSTGLRYHKEKHYRGGKSVVTGIVLKNGTAHAPNRQHKKFHELRKEASRCADSEIRQQIVRSMKGVASQIEYVAKSNSQQ